MDMREFFDTIDHNSILEILKHGDSSDDYILLFEVLYATQVSTANGSSLFEIQQEVQQGDIFSIVLFNIVLDMAFERR